MNTITPLPFVSPPAAPQPSLSEQMLRSTFLFPKTLSSPRIMNNIECRNNTYYVAVAADRACSGNDIKSANINKETNSIEPCKSSELRPKKKSVHFNAKPNIRRLTTCASDMPDRQKQRIWYSPNEYDQFKYQAAKDAGVKIVRYDNSKVGQNHHFAMIGDFDCQASNNQDASNASMSTNAHKKPYYNENEYNDTRNDENGGATCKRGLGYNFSRHRKKSKVVTRSAVMAWQTILLGQCNPAKPAVSGDNSSVTKTSIKSQMMLALVSTKCSRVAREEAKWRGNVDYKVAYPERHGNHPPISSYTAAMAGSLPSPACTTKKRSCNSDDDDDDNGICSRTNSTSSCKRQRSCIRRCGDDSQATMGHSGDLRAEV